MRLLGNTVAGGYAFERVRHVTFRFGASLLLILFAALHDSFSASADSLTVNRIDTASLLPQGDLQVSVMEILGTADNLKKVNTDLTFRYGITDKLSASLNVCTGWNGSDNSHVFTCSDENEYGLDLKYGIHREKLNSPGCAVGVNGINRDNPEVYIAFSKHMTQLACLHAGVKTNTFLMKDSPRPFAGLEVNPIPGIFRISIDYQWNFQRAKAGVLGTGLYYSLNPDCELGFIWFDTDRFPKGQNDRIPDYPLASNNSFALQCLYRF